MALRDAEVVPCSTNVASQREPETEAQMASKMHLTGHTGQVY